MTPLAITFLCLSIVIVWGGMVGSIVIAMYLPIFKIAMTLMG